MDRELKLTSNFCFIEFFERDPTESMARFLAYFLFFKYFFISLIQIWLSVGLSGWFVHVSFSLKEFTLLPGLKFKFLFSPVSQHFWWWLHWRSLQARAAPLFLPFTKVAQKYSVFLTGFVCFQMGIPFSLEKH